MKTNRESWKVLEQGRNTSGWHVGRITSVCAIVNKLEEQELSRETS